MCDLNKNSTLNKINHKNKALPSKFLIFSTSWNKNMFVKSVYKTHLYFLNALNSRK